MAGNSASGATGGLPAAPSAGARRAGFWVSVGLLVLAFGFTMALMVKPFIDHSNPFWFVGLLVIFGAALSLIAVVFQWLGLAYRDEAFGLPAGSVRSLLAIGVMVLFTVFGLVAVTVDESNFSSRVADQAISSAVAPADPVALAAEVKRYERQGMAVVVESVGASGATLKLYRVERAKPTETSDTQKQVLTSLMTLLTSIVSFYFGSRTSEAARSANDKPGQRDAAPDNTPNVTVTSGSVHADVRTLDEDIAACRERLGSLRAETATEGHEQAFATVLGTLESEAPAIDAERTKLSALLADGGNGSAQAAIMNAALSDLRKRVTTFAQRLADAESLVARG